MPEQLNSIVIAFAAFLVWLLPFVSSVLLYVFQSRRQKNEFELRTDKLDREYRDSLQAKVDKLNAEIVRLNEVIVKIRETNNLAIVALKEEHNKALLDVERRYTKEISEEREKRNLVEYRVSQLEAQKNLPAT